MATVPLFALGAGILLELFLAPVLSRRAKGWLAFASATTALAGSLFLIPATMNGQIPETNLFSWDRGISLAYHIDGLSMVFMLMATGIGAAILLYCIRYMEDEAEGTTRFYVLMLTFIAGLVNLVGTANLLIAYVSWEIVGLCSYFLVGFWYKNPQSADGSRKVLIFTDLAGYGLLAAIMLLYVQTGTFLWTNPAISSSFTTGIFLLMLVSAMAKSVIFPLHTWIPEAMNAPTPVSALLHSACYVKAGVYLVARMYSFGPWQPNWNTLVLALGCTTMIVGALFALTQTDLKRLLAFSTISQLGYILTGLGLGTDLGIAAGIFYCLSHGLFKGTLFLCSGAVQHATGTRDLRRLGGLAQCMPNTSRIWLVAAAAIIGVPLTNGFVAKWLLFDAALEAGRFVVVLVAWLVSTVTAFYILKATVSVFYGELPGWLRDREVQEVAPSMQVGMGMLATFCILFGVAPQLLMKGVVSPAVHDLGFRWTVSLSWLGVQTSSAGVQVTFGAIVAGFAFLAGFLLHQIGRGMKAKPVGVFTGGDPLPIEDDVFGAVDFVDVAETALVPFYRVADPDPVYLSLWSGLRDFAARISRAISPTVEGHPLLATLAMAFVVVLAVWLF